MARSGKALSVLIPFFLLGSSTIVSAPSFAETSETGKTVTAPPAEKLGVAVSSSTSAAAERLSKSADALAKKRLAAYVISRYGNASKATRDRFAANFATVAQSDPSAEIHPYYLVSLEKTIVANPVFKEDGAAFGAYAHVLLSLRDSNADVSAMAADRKKELETALRDATLGKMGSLSPKERSETFKTFSKLSYDPWSSSDLSKMRKTIEDKGIGSGTAYFKAYAYARSNLVNGSGSLSLLRGIPHEKQEWSLSCEANSMRDLVNYYRLGNGETAAEESSFVFILPSDPSPPKYENGVRVWADPAKTFVGRIDGRQSSNPQKLTGYGIHADGILPYVKRELKQYGLNAEKRAFDSNSIRDSLAAGNPVVFWYVFGADPSRGLSRLDWKTPEGKSVNGFIGEHVGIIVGAKIANDGSISELSYYEGRSGTLQKDDFESLSRKAKWFDEAIYVTSAEKANTESVEPKINKTKKKNLKAAIRPAS